MTAPRLAVTGDLLADMRAVNALDDLLAHATRELLLDMTRGPKYGPPVPPVYGPPEPSWCPECGQEVPG